MKEMKNIFKRYLILALPLFALTLWGCEKVEDTRDYVPVVSFELSSASVTAPSGIVADNSVFDYSAKIKLSKPAAKSFVVSVNYTGTAVYGEHYTAPKEISISAGSSEANVAITILNDNIYDELLTIKSQLAPGRDYAVVPDQKPEFNLTLTKEIILPVLSFNSQEIQRVSNPFEAETITYELTLDQTLRAEAVANISVAGDFVIGQDFLIDGGNSNTITIPAGVTSKTFEVKIAKRDEAGIDKNIELTLSPAAAKTFTVVPESATSTIRLHDPIVDLTPFFKSPALLSNPGYIIEQAILAKDGTYAGKVALNMGKAQNENWLKTYRNMTFISSFGCYSNLSGGDILRMSDLLVFATSDTVVADYGAGRTSRFFSPSEALLRFVADGENIRKGKVYSTAQTLTAKLVLKADWETGTNGNKQWHIDSKQNDGDVTKSTYPLVFDVINVNLVKIEGTFDMDAEKPTIIFDAWFSSNSPYFLRSSADTHDIQKDGELYKINYRYTPK